MIDVNPNHLETVTRILAGHVPECEVRAFGSRVTWTAKDYSDLDLVVVGERALDLDALRHLKEAFEESDLPFRVDVLDWHAISSTFRKVIEKKYEVVQKGKRKSLGRAGDSLSFNAEIVMGQSPPGEACNVVGHGLPLLNGPTEYGPHHPTPVQFTTDARKRALPGDILFCVRGSTTGRMNWADREYAIGRGVAAIRHKKRPELQPFVRAVIEHGLPGLLAQATGSTFPNVSATQLAGLWWPSLDEDEQRAIAHILGTLDDKIELNRRMNETLEAMARALFKSWFIEFDPVRRNAARSRNQPSPAASRHPLPEGEGRREGAKHYRGGFDFSGLVETVRALRKAQTPAEDVFWELVRDRRLLGLKFRRQHQVGDYIADFYCHEYRLVVELDGAIHSAKRKKDHKRDAWMEAQGITVLRFPNAEILDNPSAALRRIADTVSSASRPLPLGEGWGEGSVEELDRLFPDSFEDSELGEIPKGWRAAPLPDVFDVNPTRALRKGVEAPYLDMANMPTRGHSPDAVINRPFGSGMRFVNGDTLIARITPCLENGKTAYVDFLADGQVGWGSTEYIVLRPKPPLPDEFAYCLARGTEFREFAIQRMTGSSGRQRVPAESLSHFRVVAAPTPIAELFGRLIKPLFTRASAAAREARTLAALRDALLPRLISGDLRVKDAELFLKERGL